MNECGLAHPGRPSRNVERVRPRRHPQLLLERLVQKELMEPLASPGQVMQVLQIELIVDLKGEPRVNHYAGALTARFSLRTGSLGASREELADGPCERFAWRYLDRPWSLSVC